jgi:hypothetical protein
MGLPGEMKREVRRRTGFVTKYLKGAAGQNRIFSGKVRIGETGIRMKVIGIVKKMAGERLPLGGLWYSDYPDAR